jgi:hypothetical protein
MAYRGFLQTSEQELQKTDPTPIDKPRPVLPIFPQTFTRDGSVTAI